MVMLGKWRATLGLWVTLVPALVGCTLFMHSDRQARSEVTAPMWVLRLLKDKAVPPSRPEAVTLRLLPDHAIAGTASCNRVGGRELSWIASTDSGGTFARDPFQPTIATLMGCNDVAATHVADQFWTLMTKAREWSLERGDLIIRFDDGAMAMLKAEGRAQDTSTVCRLPVPNDPVVLTRCAREKWSVGNGDQRTSVSH